MAKSSAGFYLPTRAGGAMGILKGLRRRPDGAGQHKAQCHG
ncbi:hypothetical protein ABK905_06150 [Acerihabitans sp. KWT182]|uniref:Uncharacterized protein n=1 Tax=Acerihabitans sp. KWT182 TaxID=3157919 RepID=A0AAU7QC64_9GAMM